jgi:hypothetical protein
MSAFDELKNKAAGLVEHAKEGLENLAEGAVDKVGDAADAVTGNKFSGQIDAVQAKAHEVLGDKDEA